jgi:DNA processing protein
MSPAACAPCLRRAWLLRELAPYLERAVNGSPGGRVAELLALEDPELARVAAPRDSADILRRVGRLRERELRRTLKAARCWAACRHDESFPGSLRQMRDPPRALVGRGDSALLARVNPETTVTVVGARRASAYGREVATVLGRDLVAAGLMVVSGLALGIDGAAHRGALERGPTVAVLGCGADVAYPAAHGGLHRRTCEVGLVLSELPPGTTPWRWTFPARNRVMAGLAGMVVVVEARRRSGSLITVGFAEEQGRDVGAVPGPVTSPGSEGPNGLIASGACMVRGAQDVLDAMLGPGARAVEPTGPPLEPGLAEALACFERSDGTCESLARELDSPLGAASAALGQLELLGYVEGTAAGSFGRTVLKPAPAPPS